MKRVHRYKPAFAIIRIDLFLGETTPLENKIKVKEIVQSLDLAKTEVARLNELHRKKNVTYFWQLTQVYGDGFTAGLEMVEGKKHQTLEKTD